MQVSCPHCATRYVLPESLLGPLGARVRCPRCREAFTVDPPAPVETPTGPSIATSPAGASDSSTEWSRRIDTEPPPPPPGSRAPSAETDSEEDQAFRTPIAAPAPKATPEPDPDPDPPSAGAPAGVPPEAPAAPRAAPARTASRALDAHEVARAALEGIENGGGEGVAEAWAQGHLFAEYGQAIGEAYESYRRQLGPGADPAAFRAALRERWGVDLEPGTPVTT